MTATVSVVIVAFNNRDDLPRCLASLEASTLPLEVVVVDNASSDGSADAARHARPSARVIVLGENTGFARANNRGIRESAARYVLILNPDAEVRPGAVEALAALLDRRPEVGIVGPRTLNEDGTVQVSFGPALTPLAERRQRRLVLGVKEREPWALRAAAAASSREHEPDWVSASCLLARREALAQVGGFDEAFFLYEEDADLCLRVRAAGWRVVFTPTTEVVHRLGRSMEAAPGPAALAYHRSHVLYYRKHNGSLLTAALRLALLPRGVAWWLSGRGTALLRLALTGSSPSPAKRERG